MLDADDPGPDRLLLLHQSGLARPFSAGTVLTGCRAGPVRTVRPAGPTARHVDRAQTVHPANLVRVVRPADLSFPCLLP